MTGPGAHHFEETSIIGVIADTHVYSGGRRQLATEVLELFRRFEVRLICHAGDINDRSTIEGLGAIAEVLAVRGNNDDADLQQALPEKLMFSVGDKRIGLVHGDGGLNARTVARTAFQEPLDLVIYGHSHIPMIETVNEVIYFNPGSPTDRRFSKHFGIGLVTIESGRLVPDLILFEKARHLANILPVASQKTMDRRA